MIEDKKTKEANPLKVCVVSFPMPSALAVNVLLASLIDILEPICNELYLIAGNIPQDRVYGQKIKLVDIKTVMNFRQSYYPRWASLLIQFFRIVIIQIKMCVALFKIPKISVVILYVGGGNLFPVGVVAKFLRKRLVVFVGGRGSESYWRASGKGLFGIGGFIYSLPLRLLERVIFSLADQIIVQSQGAVDFLHLGKYKEKVTAEGARYVNTDLFRVNKDLKDRRSLVAYVGRLSAEKGVMNFLRAIPSVLKVRQDIKFSIGGYGPLRNKIEDEIENSNLRYRVELAGWIFHDELPDYLNELKLLVLPSYSEGLPTIVLETMACGTPVLATSVGGIPDVIKDGETGFILEDNSPECIARDIIEALDYPDLSKIAKNGRSLIESNYIYEAAVMRYRRILNSLGS